MRTLVLSLLFSLAAVATVNAAEFRVESLEQPISLEGVWRFRTGDDLAWADPGYDHGRWDNILAPRDWRRQGYKEYTGFAWYRATVEFDLSRPGLERQLGELGVAVSKVHSAYELYAGGNLLGGAGRLPPDPEVRHDRVRILSIPRSAIDENGELTLALRVWREDLLGGASPSGMYEGKFLLGNSFQLMQEIWFGQVAVGVLALIYLVFGAYHIYLYWRNRQLPEFLWFGLTAIMVGIYSLEVSQWKHVLQLAQLISVEAHKNIEYAVVYLLPAVGLQLVWSLLRWEPWPVARAYQAVFPVLALLVLLLPGHAFETKTLFAWQMFVLPGLAALLVHVIWSAIDGNDEARTMVLGWGLFLATAINDILVSQGQLSSGRYLAFGFAAVLLSMALSVANRFTRMYHHLDGEVRERTAELQRSNEKLSAAARMDSLTGLLNRRGFAEKAKVEIARARRTRRGFVVMMADIDHFKDFNDQQGHACGDFVLQETAQLLVDQLRDVDTIARWGGEEFIFLLPETSLEGGRVLAEKLRSVLEQTQFSYENIALGLTVTIGVSEYHLGMSLDDCLDRADAALYAGKQAGRNRVVTDQAGPPRAQQAELSTSS